MNHKKLVESLRAKFGLNETLRKPLFYVSEPDCSQVIASPIHAKEFLQTVFRYNAS